MKHVDKPPADSQYRLLPCNCGADEAGYQVWPTYGGGKQFRVKCPACGQETPCWPCKHDAQLDWNRRFGRRT